jgi:large subunit ribosomal protein L30
MAKVEITLKRSRFGRVPKHRKTLEALGLKRLNQTVVHEDTPVIRGMIEQVNYAIEVNQHKD